MIVRLVEVAPRDGFQMIGPMIPVEHKVGFITDAHRAGLRHIEVGAFVRADAVPQMSDTREVLAALASLDGLDGLDARVLVPNARGAERALDAGARHLVFVLSASETHNRRNVGRPVAASVADYAAVVGALPRGVAVRLNLATSFDCPFEGTIVSERVLAVLDRLLSVRDDVELALCDTTGRADPASVEALVTTCRERFGARTTWAFHGHDTYGLGLANIVAAYRGGVRVFDTSFGGLGGCPFAPGATGNTATEDAVWMFERMGIGTGVAFDLLLDVALRAAALPGAVAGGRARIAAAARQAAA